MGTYGYSTNVGKRRFLGKGTSVPNLPRVVGPNLRTKTVRDRPTETRSVKSGDAGEVEETVYLSSRHSSRLGSGGPTRVVQMI